MVISMVLGANTRLNDIIAVNGVSDIISPTTILVGHPSLDYYVITIISFRTYAQFNDEPDPTKVIIQRTNGVTALHHVGMSKARSI